jgi:hypothetical protein
MQLTLTGGPADLAAFCQAVGRQPRIDDFAESKVYDSVEDYLARMPQEPVKRPGLKDRDLLTTMLPKPGSSSLEAIGEPQKLSKEAKQFIQTIVQGQLLAGNDWATIQTALDEEGIHLTDRQLHGWIGQVKKGMKAQDRPKDAPKAELEGNCSSTPKDAVKEPLKRLDELTQRPCNLSEPDLTIWKMHVAGNMDIDIRQKLDRMGHPMKVADIRRRIDELNMGQVKA